MEIPLIRPVSPGQDASRGLALSSGHGYAYSAARPAPFVHQSGIPNLPVHQEHTQNLVAREHARHRMLSSASPHIPSSPSGHRRSYPVSSYAGMMAALPPDQDLATSATHMSAAMAHDENDEPLTHSRRVEAAHLTEYLASGEFERNVAQRYEDNSLTQPGQPLRDLAMYMADTDQRRRTPGNRHSDISEDASRMRRREREYGASAFAREVNAQLSQIEPDGAGRVTIPANPQPSSAIVDYSAGTRRASQRVVDGLQELDVSQLAADDRCCTICMEVMGEPEPVEGKVELPVRLPCGHVFGKACIKTWFYDHCTCPACRRKVESELSFPRSHGRRSSQPRAGFDTFRDRAQAITSAGETSFYVAGLTDEMFGAPPTVARSRARGAGSASRRAASDLPSIAPSTGRQTAATMAALVSGVSGVESPYPSTGLPREGARRSEAVGSSSGSRPRPYSMASASAYTPASGSSGYTFGALSASTLTQLSSERPERVRPAARASTGTGRARASADATSSTSRSGQSRRSRRSQASRAIAIDGGE